MAGSWLAGGVIRADVFRDQPVLHAPTVRLEPLTSEVLSDYLRAMDDPEVTRLTGTHATFDPEVVAAWLDSRAEHHDRADWAIHRASDGAFLGEAVLNDLDVDNDSVSYRIWLAGPQVFGRGYGSEATAAVVDYAFALGLHRVALEVYEHNPRARRAYERCGFVLEGRLRQALSWQGRRYDAVVMAILRTDSRPLP